MTQFKISGIWKDNDEVITHYAFHEVYSNGQVSKGRKTSKEDAVKLLSDSANQAITWLWNYSQAFWVNGARVEVVDKRYLRTVHDNKLIDNLSHLINYDYL